MRHLLTYGICLAPILAVHAQVCGTNLFADHFLANLLFAPYLKTAAGDEKATAVDNTIKADVMRALNGQAEKCPTLILCPRLTDKHFPVHLKPSTFGDLWDTARATRPQAYHLDVAEHFASVVNSYGSAKHNEASTRYADMYGNEAHYNNLGFFMFKSSFEPEPGAQERYRGPPYNFQDAFYRKKIVPLSEDVFVYNWVKFWLAFQQGSVLSNNDYVHNIWVSKSSTICWDLLLQGRRHEIHNTPNALPTPRHAFTESANTPMALTWEEMCISKCGERLQSNTCSSRAMCKQQCLDDKTCKGYYFDTLTNTGELRTIMPSEQDLARADGAFDSFHQLNRNLLDSNLAFNEYGTSNVRSTVVDLYTYVKEQQITHLAHKIAYVETFLTKSGCNLNSTILANAHNSSNAWNIVRANCTNNTHLLPRIQIYKSLQLCKQAKVATCFHSEHQVFGTDGTNEWFPQADKWVIRQYNDPLPCKQKCLHDPECLAWTWRKTACKHFKSIGTITESAIAPDLQVLEDLGFNTSVPCANNDHAFDMCVDQCVNIHNKLHHGWCNHKWTNCKSGKFANKQSFIPHEQKGDLAVCTGGSHPENPTLVGEDIVKTVDDAGPEFYSNSAEHGDVPIKIRKTNAKLSKRKAIQLPSTKTGAYTATTCGDIGAAYMKPNEFQVWQSWSKQHLHTDVDSRMSSLFHFSENITQHSWTTRTFVGMSRGDRIALDGSAYSSPVAGLNDDVADGKIAPIQFPKCQIPTQDTQSCTNLYSFTRHGQGQTPCSQTPYANIKGFYNTAVKELEGNPDTQGTPFVNAVVSKNTLTHLPKFTTDCSTASCTAAQEGTTCLRPAGKQPTPSLAEYRQLLDDTGEPIRRIDPGCYQCLPVQGTCPLADNYDTSEYFTVSGTFPTISYSLIDNFYWPGMGVAINFPASTFEGTYETVRQKVIQECNLRCSDGCTYFAVRNDYSDNLKLGVNTPTDFSHIFDKVLPHCYVRTSDCTVRPKNDPFPSWVEEMIDPNAPLAYDVFERVVENQPQESLKSCCVSGTWQLGACPMQADAAFTTHDNKQLMCFTRESSGQLKLTNNVAAQQCSTGSDNGLTHLLNVAFERAIGDHEQCYISSCDMDTFVCDRNICQESSNSTDTRVQMPVGTVCSELSDNTVSSQTILPVLSGFNTSEMTTGNLEVMIDNDITEAFSTQPIIDTLNLMQQFKSRAPNNTEIKQFQNKSTAFYIFAQAFKNIDVTKALSTSGRFTSTQSIITSGEESQRENTEPSWTVPVAESGSQNQGFDHGFMQSVTSTVGAVAENVANVYEYSVPGLIIGTVGDLFSGRRRRTTTVRPIITPQPTAAPTPATTNPYITEASFGIDRTELWPQVNVSDTIPPHYTDQITYESTFEAQCLAQCDNVCKNTQDDRCRYCIYQISNPLSIKTALTGISATEQSFWKFIDRGCPAIFASEIEHSFSDTKSAFDNMKSLVQNILGVKCSQTIGYDIWPSNAPFMDNFVLPTTDCELGAECSENGQTCTNANGMCCNDFKWFNGVCADHTIRLNTKAYFRHLYPLTNLDKCRRKNTCIRTSKFATNASEKTYLTAFDSYMKDNYPGEEYIEVDLPGPLCDTLKCDECQQATSWKNFNTTENPTSDYPELLWTNYINNSSHPNVECLSYIGVTKEMATNAARALVPDHVYVNLKSVESSTSDLFMEDSYPGSPDHTQLNTPIVHRSSEVNQASPVPSRGAWGVSFGKQYLLHDVTSFSKRDALAQVALPVLRLIQNTNRMLKNANPLCTISSQCTIAERNDNSAKVTSVFQQAQTQVSSESLAESVELDDLVEVHGALQKRAVHSMKPPKGHIQNAQRAFTAKASRAQASTYSPGPERVISNEQARIPCPGNSYEMPIEETNTDPGRCGPLFNHSICPKELPYCNEINGHCSHTEVDRTIQSRTKYNYGAVKCARNAAANVSAEISSCAKNGKLRMVRLPDLKWAHSKNLANRHALDNVQTISVPSRCISDSTVWRAFQEYGNGFTIEALDYKCVSSSETTTFHETDLYNCQLLCKSDSNCKTFSWNFISLQCSWPNSGRCDSLTRIDADADVLFRKQSFHDFVGRPGFYKTPLSDRCPAFPKIDKVQKLCEQYADDNPDVSEFVTVANGTDSVHPHGCSIRGQTIVFNPNPNPVPCDSQSGRYCLCPNLVGNDDHTHVRSKIKGLYKIELNQNWIHDEGRDRELIRLVTEPEFHWSLASNYTNQMSVKVQSPLKYGNTPLWTATAVDFTQYNSTLKSNLACALRDKKGCETSTVHNCLWRDPVAFDDVGKQSSASCAALASQLVNNPYPEVSEEHSIIEWSGPLPISVQVNLKSVYNQSNAKPPMNFNLTSQDLHSNNDEKQLDDVSILFYITETAVKFGLIPQSPHYDVTLATINGLDASDFDITNKPVGLITHTLFSEAVASTKLNSYDDNECIMTTGPDPGLYDTAPGKTDSCADKLPGTCGKLTEECESSRMTEQTFRRMMLQGLQSVDLEISSADISDYDGLCNARPELCHHKCEIPEYCSLYNGTYKSNCYGKKCCTVDRSTPSASQLSMSPVSDGISLMCAKKGFSLETYLPETLQEHDVSNIAILGVGIGLRPSNDGLVVDFEEAGLTDTQWCRMYCSSVLSSLRDIHWDNNFEPFEFRVKDDGTCCCVGGPRTWTKILDTDLIEHQPLSPTGTSLYNDGYHFLKIEAGDRTQIFDSNSYNLSNLDNTCDSCNCKGNDLGNGLFWHGGGYRCYGSIHYGLSTTDDVHISCHDSDNSWWGHFHRAGVNTGVYGFGKNNCIQEQEGNETFKLYASKKHMCPVERVNNTDDALQWNSFAFSPLKDRDSDCVGFKQYTVFYTVCQHDQLHWSPRVAVTRNPNPDIDGITWKAHIATATNDSRGMSSVLPGVIPGQQSSPDTPPDYNAANAGFKCPTGIYYGDVSDNSADNLKSDAHWHPLAQTTLMCPSSKPVRCSKLTVVDPVGGTCEYSSETAKQQYRWSGQRPIPLSNMQYSAENWKSKIGNNAPCHVYDFSCHSITDDIDTSVCGYSTDYDEPLGGIKCGEKSGNEEGYCGIDSTTGNIVNEKKATCEWPTQGRTICPTGFVLKWGNNSPYCDPATHVTKEKGWLRKDTSAILETDPASKRLWWPGFRSEKYAFGGVGPKWASLHPKCDNSVPFAPFIGCGELSGDTNTPQKVIQECCNSSRVYVDTKSIHTCAAKPSASCGAGQYMHNRPEFLLATAQSIETESSINTNRCPQTYPFTYVDGTTVGCCAVKPRFNSTQQSESCPPHFALVATREPTPNSPTLPLLDYYTSDSPGERFNHLDRFCECASEQCSTSVSTAYTESLFSFGQNYSYLPQVKEMFFEMYDSDSKQSLQGESCRGIANRLEGALWRVSPPTNPLVSHGFDAEQNPAVMPLEHCHGDCDTDEHCKAGYICHQRDEESSVPGCTGTPNNSMDYCIRTPSREKPGTCACQSVTENQVVAEFLCNPMESCAYNQVMGGQRGLLSLDYYKNVSNTPVRSFDTFHQAEQWCMYESDCKGLLRHANNVFSMVTNESQVLPCTGCSTMYFQKEVNDVRFIWTSSTMQTPFTSTFVIYTGSLTAAKAKCTTNLSCNTLFIALDPSDNTFGTIYWESPSGLSTTLPTGLIKYNTDRQVDDKLGNCPPRKACAHGTNYIDTDGLCKCRCDAFWKGTLCDICTSENREPDCKQCRKNFNTGMNDVCICMAGFDIRTQCTTCLPGIMGALCQTDTCSYKLEDTIDAKAIHLDNIVVAYNENSILYDGIKSAGDKHIPLSMVHTFVKQAGKLWWLDNTTRYRVLEDVYYDNIIHHTTGEWLWTIPASTDTLSLNDVIQNPKFDGKVCTFTQEIGTLKDNANDRNECAQACQPPYCKSWHWNNAEQECVILEEHDNFVESEYNVQSICSSGGIYGAGPLRNLPNKVELAVPEPNQLLQQIPVQLRNRVICAYNDNVPYVLSMYRRHKWTDPAANCSSTRVQFSWLYSIPRGTPMNKQTIREEWYEGLPPLQLNEPFGPANSAFKCAQHCDSDCSMWIFHNSQCHLNAEVGGTTETPDMFGGTITAPLNCSSCEHITEQPNLFAISDHPQIEATVPTRQACCDMCSAHEAWDISGALCSCYGNPKYERRKGSVTSCRVPRFINQTETCSTSYQMDQMIEHPDTLLKFGCKVIQTLVLTVY